MEHHAEEMELVAPDEGGWYRTQIYDWIMLHPGLSHYEVRVYAVMRSLCIEKRAPVRRLRIEELRLLVPGVNGKESGRSTVMGALRTLREIGLVEALDPSTSGGAVRYRINDMPRDPAQYQGWRNAFEKLEHIRQGTHSEPVQKSGHPVQKTEQGVQKTRHPVQKTGRDTPSDQGKHNPLRSSIRSSTRSSTKNAHHARPVLFDVDSSDSSQENAGKTDLAFERFWKVYPRKTAKQDARRAFEKAAKKHGPDLLVQQAERWGELWARAGFEKQFIPYPTTWLNGERWTDEPPAPRQLHQSVVNGGHIPYRNANPDAYHANF